MPQHKPLITNRAPEDIARAADVLRGGGLVAFPTETVYGLGADARNANAVARIYAAKGRPDFNPLIVHVDSLDRARRVVTLPDWAGDLAEAFWPGPLTLVLPARADAGIAPAVQAGHPTLAIRVPAHDTARALLAAFGGPVAAPSANPSGRISPTTAAHVATGLGTSVDMILDAGPTRVGLESTIVGMGPDGPRVLRPGGVPAEDLQDALQRPVRPAQQNAQAPVAPGQLASHYAPRARLRLNVARPRSGEVLLGFGPVSGATENLSRQGNLSEAAAALFNMLHKLDAAGHTEIAVSPIPEEGLGAAINDRLRRAAAPR